MENARRRQPEQRLAEHSHFVVDVAHNREQPGRFALAADNAWALLLEFFDGPVGEPSNTFYSIGQGRVGLPSHLAFSRIAIAVVRNGEDRVPRRHAEAQRVLADEFK